MPVFGLGTANGEAVFLVKVDDVFFFDFFEDGWHGMKDGGISHPTDLTSLCQLRRLIFTIGIYGKMIVSQGFSKSGVLKRGMSPLVSIRMAVGFRLDKKKELPNPVD